MVFKFEEKLKQLGLTEDKLSAKIKTEIAEIRAAASDEDTDQDKLNSGDEEIVVMIEKYHSKMGTFAAMQEGRKRKAEEKKMVTGGQVPVANPTPAVTGGQVPVANPTHEGGNEGSGGISFGAIIGGVVLFAGAIFGINFFRNKK